MGNPYLNNDESIILATHNVMFRSVRSDMILTNQRLIMSDSSHTQFRPRVIPLAVVMTVTKSETGTGEPGFTLSLVTPDGATQPRELVFSQRPHKKREQECDEWIKRIGEFSAKAREAATSTGVSVADMAAMMAAEEQALDTEQQGTVSGQPGGSPAGRPAPGSCRRQFPKTSSKKVAILAVVAIIIIAIALVVGVYVNSMPQKGGAVPTVMPTMTPVPTTAVMTPVPTATTIPAPTTVVTAAQTSAPQIPIPQEGVWVRVESPVTYVGTVGISGNLQEVNATGMKFYRVPAAQTDVLDITVQKQSGYRDPLNITVYNNGNLVKVSSTTTPMGTIELHIRLNEALPNSTPTS
jgi:hypothetical protein